MTPEEMARGMARGIALGHIWSESDLITLITQAIRAAVEAERARAEEAEKELNEVNAHRALVRDLFVCPTCGTSLTILLMCPQCGIRYELRDAYAIPAEFSADDYIRARREELQKTNLRLLSKMKDLQAEREDLLTKLYRVCHVCVAQVCDEQLDRSGALLGRIRARAQTERPA